MLAESQLAAQLTIGIVIKLPWCSVGAMFPRGLLNIYQRDRRAALAAGDWYQVDCEMAREALAWAAVSYRMLCRPLPGMQGDAQHIFF